METAFKDVLTPTGKEPRLWIRRIALLEHPDMSSVIRDIPLTRGLNIIYGKGANGSSDRQDENFFSQSGHSVGKTTFCRIVRFLLGEPVFGTQKAQETIREHFTDGWAAGEIIIDGEIWGVARSFSTRSRPKVGQEVSIEDLFAPEFSTIGFGEYEQALRRLLPPHADLPGFTFEWKHLLAWLTRDQEARLRNYWAWRDKGSESKTTFPAPVEHPRHLARAVFQMVSSRTEQLERSISEVKVRHHEAQEELDRQLSEPILRREDAKRCLSNLLPIDSKLAESGGPMFSYEMQAETEMSRLDKEIAQKYEELKAVDNQLARLVPLLHNLKNKIEVSSEAVNFQQDKIKAVDDPKDDPDEHRLKKLEQRAQYTCEYAPHMKIGDCPEAQKELNNLRNRKIFRLDEQKRRQADRSSQKEYEAQLFAAKEKQRKDIDDYNESIDLKNSFIRKRSILVRSIDDFLRNKSEIKKHAEVLKEQEINIEGNIPNSAINSSRQKVDDLSAELDFEEQQLKEEKQSSLVSIDAICSIFSVCIESVLGDHYSGSLEKDNEFLFNILEDGELSGAVVDTLAIILGDVTATLCSSQGMAVHPGFLLHDSPREADLASSLYRKVFNLIIDIVTFFGGYEVCPFQYIMTTTTAAPRHAAPFIKLELAHEPEERLLFKRKLIPKKQPQQLQL